MRCRGTVIYSLAFCLGLLALPGQALACGGFFCSQVNVDQTAERILFEVHPNNTISTTVEIQFSGDSESFSWVIPLPDLQPPPEGLESWESPTSDDNDISDDDDDDDDDEVPPYLQVPPSALRVLDAITRPQIIAPPINWDDDGWGGDDDDDAAGSDDFDSAPNAESGVKVDDLAQVGNYVGQLISSDDPEALIDWLNDNGYVITPEMEPYVAGYVAQDMVFLGIQLSPDTTNAPGSTPPLMITYSGTEPMLPLTLTSVSAEPEMGFVAFVAGESNYEASNFASLPVETSLLQMDPRTSQSNYYGLISWLADEEDGHAFFHEYSDSMSNLNSLVGTAFLGTQDQMDAEVFVSNLTGRHERVTRLYSRMSNWEMTQDPVFTPIAAGTEVISNIHDLSQRPAVSWNDTPYVPCAESYCGLGGSCATTATGIDGCACETGYVARAITAPAISQFVNSQTVACQQGSFDLLGSTSATLSDPCDSYSCGVGGTCVPLNGSPTCLCGAGYAAINMFGQVSCSLAQTSYGPEQLLWGDWTTVPIGDDDDDDDDDDVVTDDDDTPIATDDDDSVSTDDDDDDDDDSQGDGASADYDGIDTRLACGCTAAATDQGGAGSGAGLALLLSLGLGLGLRRRRQLS